MKERKEAEVEIGIRYESLQGTMTERSRRLFAGCEALAFGYGGIEAVSRATGLSKSTVKRGLEECREIESGQAPKLSLSNRARVCTTHSRLYVPVIRACDVPHSVLYTPSKGAQSRVGW